MAAATERSDTFKEAQHRAWNNAAAGWRAWWPTWEEGLRPISERLLSLAHVSPGCRVIDVGTGIGEPALTAARRRRHRRGDGG